ncbi:MAG: hypothetical protein GXO43_06960 [Crenarchaeota archaeon]|nr:hypothetical protein [Thermoproteota archaeon]
MDKTTKQVVITILLFIAVAIYTYASFTVHYQVYPKTCSKMASVLVTTLHEQIALFLVLILFTIKEPRLAPVIVIIQAYILLMQIDIANTIATLIPYFIIAGATVMVLELVLAKISLGEER